jgi:hypothetical protein
MCLWTQTRVRSRLRHVTNSSRHIPSRRQSRYPLPVLAIPINYVTSNRGSAVGDQLEPMSVVRERVGSLTDTASPSFELHGNVYYEVRMRPPQIARHSRLTRCGHPSGRIQRAEMQARLFVKA